MEIEVRCYGQEHREVRLDSPTLRATGYGLDTSAYTAPKPLHSVFGAVQRCLDWNTTNIDADIVHLHTWYTHFGGIMAKLNYGIPMVLTVHSLEPLRPWKREQLGGGYDVSSWIERMAIETADAVIAVSEGTRADVLRLFAVAEERIHVIHNGIDAEFWQPDPATDVLERYGVDPSTPFVLFVGRITRQKGIVHLVRAIQRLDPGFGVVLCAGQPDTAEIAREMEEGVEAARVHRSGVTWIPEMLSRSDVRQLYSQAALFVCPSVYEPFGIINLEAMACERPVVASAVGGIPEVVVDGETGVLVPVELRLDDPMTPVDPARFEADLADAVNRLMADPSLREGMGRAGRERAVAQFSWSAIANQTVALYQTLIR